LKNSYEMKGNRKRAWIWISRSKMVRLLEMLYLALISNVRILFKMFANGWNAM
jgi:hypothetical protein